MLSVRETKTVQIQGHRGWRSTWPENSIPGFLAAIEAGVSRLELDLVVTSDGELIIFHDLFLNPERCTYRDGSDIENPALLIYSLPLDAIKKIDCGRKVHPLFPHQKAFPGAEIPTLRTFLAAVQDKEIFLNLELKRDPMHPEYSPKPEWIAEAVVGLVEQEGWSSRVYYSSFDPQILKEIRKVNPEAVLGFLQEEQTQGILETAKELAVQIVSPEQGLLQDDGFVSTLKEHGFKVIPWTVNDFNRALELIQLGVEGLITDYPDDFMKRLTALGFDVRN